MNKKVLVIVGIVSGLLLLCACAGVAFFAFSAQNIVNSVSTIEAPLVIAETAVPAAPVVDPNSTPAENTGLAAGAPTAEEVADSFLTHLALERYDEAADATAAELRNDATMATQLEGIVIEKGLRPAVWTWTGVQEETEKGETYFNGVVQYFDDRRGYVTVETRVENGAWMVYFLDLKADETLSVAGPAAGWSEDQKALELAIAETSADLFLEDWQNGDLASAYEYSHQTLKDEVGSAEKLAEILNGTGLQLNGWQWDAYEILEQGEDESPVLSLTGTAAFQDNMTGPVAIQLRSSGANWAVSFFDVKTQ